ncbi:hypothetical protein H5P28_05610 [Ruficoccus amylovorans]|uniref:TIGR03067 domain-containing protein n=1 Tax=Ruficoccus amylovorans TaxID=1804625 RepID=A0A842HBE2_9BACT|nr:hypothetical protein [Ruficoccus amylovorans]MBC2593735.1 hypothetical protein [Ruficoccus amylovorans]
MKLSPYVCALVLSLCPAMVFALPASQRNGAKFVKKAEQIEGSWVSTDLSGDAIWLVVDTVGVVFSDDGRFKATAVLEGGSRKSLAGPYHLDLGKVRLEPKGWGTQICTYSIDGGVLTLYNEAHGITAKFKRGELPAPQPRQSAPTGGMPGMGF